MSRLLAFSALVLMVCLCQPLTAAEIPEGVTIDDLIQRVQIPLLSISPDGRYASYLTVTGSANENLYNIAVSLIATDGNGKPVLLSHAQLQPEQVFDTLGGVQKNCAQFLWSPDSGELLYTAHRMNGMELRLRAVNSGSERILLGEAERIEIDRKGEQLEVRTFRSASLGSDPTPQPQDYSLLVKDGYRFYEPLTNPKKHGKLIVQRWGYTWGQASLYKTTETDEVSYLGGPEEWLKPGPAVGFHLARETSTSVVYMRDEK